MSDVFIQLSLKEQSQILNTLAAQIGKSAIILEKDIWIVWALKTLFEMPNRFQMAFKGGTSLSKVYNLIQRFSEDVDITIDYSEFASRDPLIENISNTQIKKMSDDIKSLVTAHLKDCVLPYFRGCIDLQFKKNVPTIELDDDGETLHFYYPSSLADKSGYIADSVRLEFGGRNKSTPQNSYEIVSDVASTLPTVIFPSAEIVVLSPEKTFWEKVTLIHSECNRTSLKTDANRISRHWYDVVKLAEDQIGISAIKNLSMLRDVVALKQVFYRSAYSNYDDCLNGKIKLLPNAEYLHLLKDDFNKMLEEKMFYDEIPDFDLTMEKISKLEKHLNDVILISLDR